MDPNRPSLLGVLYAEDFDDEDPAPAVAEHPPEPEVIDPVFSVAELDAARAEGRAAGRAEAERSLLASRTHMLGLLAAGVAEARSAATEVATQVADGVVRCMLGALVACLPATCKRHGAAELSALTQIILPALRDEPRIAIRVHPHMLAAMQAEVAALDVEIAERVVLMPTDAVAPGDARISWANGSAVRDTERARLAVADALAELGLLEQEMVDA